MLGDRPWFKFWPEGVPRHIDYPEIPLFGFLSDGATQYPDNIAFSYRGCSLTYEELDITTNKASAGLCDLGMRKGDAVVLFLSNSLEFVIGYYGVLKGGGIVVPVNPLCKAKELKHLLNDSGASVIIVNRNSFPVAKGVKNGTKLKTIILSDSEGIEEAVSLREILTRCSASPPMFDLRPKEDIAAIMYTGGTTGFPKGVMLTHYNLVTNAIQNAMWFGWSNQDVIIGALPFSHSWGACTCVNSPIYAGARVIIFPRFDAEDVLSTVERERATVLYGATSMFFNLGHNPSISRYDLSSLRYVKAGAMPIPPELKKRWEQVTGVRMVFGYGLSEASPETHNCPLQRVKSGTVGMPIMDTDARIVDEKTGEIELPPGKVGELVIKGPQIMRGYLNRPEDNRQAFRDGWLYTGDVAFMDEEGYFHIVDRKKEIIKYKGYTIAPAEVESVLYEHPAVKECAVVGKPDAFAGELPKAYVVLKHDCELREHELIEFCKQRVSPYKKIREVQFVSEIPKNSSGKILRRVLRDKERGL